MIGTAAFAVLLIVLSAASTSTAFAQAESPFGPQRPFPPNPTTPGGPSSPGLPPIGGSALSSMQPMSPGIGPPLRDQFFVPNRPRRSIKHDSWIYIDPPEVRVVKVHDIITIIVDEKSEVTSNSRFNRSRQATLKAQLNEFIRFGERGNLRPAAESTQPTIDSNLNGRFNGTGQQTDQEGIRYRIAATVVDVLPNGNIVLEARKTIQTNRDIWSYSLTGVLRSADILRNNTALSENIADLKIVKRKTGKINDSARLPWGSRLVDIFFPF